MPEPLSSLAECWELHSLLRRLLTLAVQLSGAELGRAWLVQPQGLVLWYEAHQGRPGPYHGQLLPQDHPLGQLLRRGRGLHPLPGGALGLNLAVSTGRVVGIVELHGATAADPQLEVLGSVGAGATEQALARLGAIVAMVRMAQVHDPRETPAHAMRVGAIAAEIYAQWARDKNLRGPGVDRNRQIIQLAAALHDVGKVGVNPRILQKPGALNKAELAQMKLHTIAGARILAPPATELEQLAMEIALGHHERFDGTGYPGPIEDLWGPEPGEQPGLKAERIPLAARIVAIADVYDALTSSRVYREPWPEEKVLDIIRSGAGRQFDPELVEAFFAAYPAITAAIRPYPEDWIPPASPSA